MLWEMKYTVTVLEYDFYFTHLFEADYEGEAIKKAHAWCHNFYGHGVKEIHLNNDTYEFSGGCPMLTITSVREIDKEEWKEKMFESKFLNSIN